MKRKTLHIGIMTHKNYMERTLAIAKGEYKLKKGEPKVWFESVKSLSQVLSPENQELMRLIIIHKPKSITELESISNRKKSNLSRTLKTLESYGIITTELVDGKKRPVVVATDFLVHFGLTVKNWDHHQSKRDKPDNRQAAMG